MNINLNDQKISLVKNKRNHIESQPKKINNENYFFSVKSVLKQSIAKILHSRNISINLINMAKYNQYQKRRRTNSSKLFRSGRILRFGISKKFTILTLNLFQKCFKYKNINLLVNFLAFLFKKNIRKPRVFFRFIEIVIGYFYTFYRLEGIQISFKGRINGARRARTLTIKKGTLPLNTVKTNLLYDYSNIYTIHGVYSVKA